jgi:hypothetical protein
MCTKDDACTAYIQLPILPSKYPCNIKLHCPCRRIFMLVSLLAVASDASGIVAIRWPKWSSTHVHKKVPRINVENACIQQLSFCVFFYNHATSCDNVFNVKICDVTFTSCCKETITNSAALCREGNIRQLVPSFLNSPWYIRYTLLNPWFTDDKVGASGHSSSSRSASQEQGFCWWKEWWYRRCVKYMYVWMARCIRKRLECTLTLYI